MIKASIITHNTLTQSLSTATAEEACCAPRCLIPCLFKLSVKTPSRFQASSCHDLCLTAAFWPPVILHPPTRCPQTFLLLPDPPAHLFPIANHWNVSAHLHNCYSFPHLYHSRLLPSQLSDRLPMCLCVFYHVLLMPRCSSLHFSFIARTTLWNNTTADVVHIKSQQHLWDYVK